MGKKKIPVKDFVLKMRDAVVQLVRTTKELQKTLTQLQKKIDFIEKRVSTLDTRISKLEETLTTGASPASIPTTPIEEGSAEEIFEEPEFVDLARELGVELSETRLPPEEIPTPPPAPPIETVEEPKKTEPAKTQEPAKAAVLGIPKGEEAGTEDLKKEKDELLKALEELDVI